MSESGIDRAAGLAIANPYRNPRPLERGAIRELIALAWAGERPLTAQRKPSILVFLRGRNQAAI
jgi:hypothetical protein